MAGGADDPAQVLAALQKQLQKIRIPTATDRVFKDECVFSFDSPDTETGLYVCLATFLGFGRQHVEKHFANTENAVFLHIRRIKTRAPNLLPVAQRQLDADGNQQAKRLAIGVEGGFDLAGPKYDVEERFQLVVLPDFLTIPLPNSAIPLKVSQSVDAVKKSNSARTTEELQPWDGEQRFATKHADKLFQVTHPPKILPGHWKCEECDVVANLWMNMSDGKILCGQKNFDGFGGNNHAVEHYKKVGYPLAVKLDTITPTGADVYSYDEDDMVTDPNLAVHLSHFGINLQTMEKTERSMAKLELDLNQKNDEGCVLQEIGAKLQPLYGPGYTGMINLGNSCYLNSVVQVLFALPEFKAKYFFGCEHIFSRHSTISPADDLTAQMAKMAVGLWSGSHSKPPSDLAKVTEISDRGITPFMFKSLVGKGHTEFSTERQQDAEELVRHLLTLIERSNRGGKSVADCFNFRVEDRVECHGSSKVRYPSHTDCVWALPIPMEAATNKHEVALYEEKKATAQADGSKWEGDVIRPVIGFESCIQAFATQEEVQDFYSTALRRKTKAYKSMRFGTFPDYLFIQLKKFTVGPDWTPKKLDVSVDMPDTLDIAYLRGYGKQPEEELLPEDDDEFVTDYVMGFGLTREQATVVHKTDEVVEEELAWIFSHPDDAQPAGPPTATATAEKPPAEIRDGPGVYRLRAFISHMGTSTSCGHYVCHILKDDRWVIFNDEKVAQSETPPKDLGYLYLYERIDVEGRDRREPTSVTYDCLCCFVQSTVAADVRQRYKNTIRLLPCDLRNTHFSFAYKVWGPRSVVKNVMKAFEPPRLGLRKAEMPYMEYLLDEQFVRKAADVLSARGVVVYRT